MFALKIFLCYIFCSTNLLINIFTIPKLTNFLNGRKLEYQEETQTDTQTTCELHAEGPCTPLNHTFNYLAVRKCATVWLTSPLVYARPLNKTVTMHFKMLAIHLYQKIFKGISK